MSKTTAIAICATAIALGFGVPGICLYASLFYGFNYVAASIVAIIALIMAGTLVVLGIVQGPLGSVMDDSGRFERQKLRTLRDHQRATLDELDGIVDVLGDIRDLLKSVEE